MRLRGKPGGLLALLAAMLLLGIGLTRLQSRTEASAPEGPVTVEAALERVARTDEGGLVITARLISIGGEPGDVRATLFSKPTSLELFEGQRVRLIARLKSLHGPDNPGEPDLATPRWRAGIAFSGTFDPDRVAALSAPPAISVWMERQHESLSRESRARAPDAASSALYLTLAAGARASLPEEVEDAFARSGLVHVLSVSGLHVAALALMLLKVLRLLVTLLWRGGRKVDSRRVAAPLAVPFVWAYVAYTGWQGPAVRSAVMASVVLLGLALWRRSDSLNSLSIAALLVVCVWPAAVVDLSLQLSFLAICSLLIVAPAFREAVPVEAPEPSSERTLRYRLGRLRETCLQTACASAAVVFASIPIVSSAFGRMSLAGLISNVVCLPLCGAITGLAAGGAASFAVHPILATPFIWAGTRASWLLVFAAKFFGRMPGASIGLPPISGVLALLFFAGLFAFALSRGKARWLGVLAPLSVAFAFLAPIVMPQPALSVTFLAVGQGDAIVVSSGGHHALVDGGGIAGGSDVGARVVLPFLRSERIGSVDLAVLSHPHPDHALGLISVLPKIPTRTLWLGAGAEDGPLLSAVRSAAGDADVQEVEAGAPAYQLGYAKVEVLGPPKDRVLLEGVNDRSVVLRVRFGDVSVLLTGDVEAAAEETLETGPVTVMKAPHHGSSTSSSKALLDRARPKVVVFCVGRNNRFHFPAEEVVERYRDVGAECYRTDTDGAVRILSDGRDVRVVTWHPHEQAAPEDAALPKLAQAEDGPQPWSDDPR